ncbi:MAG: sterol desaturase [Archangium gephyra]|uniref:Sterol desaturase n=1 Tax=Archangium gephyra TaxID=48 RepID=A0A2W5SWH0_9BACT|nr:MAG: sterol desaturase [Archangium gephyra]
MKRLAFTVVALMVMHAARYVVMAGGAYLFFWRWRGNPLTAKGRTQRRAFERADLWREFRWSMLTCVVFGVMFGVAFTGQAPKPLTHSGFAAVLEFFGWLAVVLIIHDTFFYWSHRLLHHPLLFARVHAVHHRSHTPSPFSALAFHPLEAMLQGVWALPLFLLPIPTVVWLAFAVAAITINVVGHCGVEVVPQRLRASLPWLNYTTNHDAHHAHVRGNYGLYFSLWDRVMGTRS